MSISRRQFILGTAAGLILPAYYDKILTLWENHGEALIEAPKDAKIELIAIDRGGDGLELNWGDPWEEPPELTIREFARRYYGDEEYYIHIRDEDPNIDLDVPMDWWDVVDTWSYIDSPNAKAYRLLEDLDLGPSLSGKDAVGEIRFIDGACPGVDYLGVVAPSPIDVCLLQKRLNDLQTGIRISMLEGR